VRRRPYIASGRGWLVGDWPSTGGVLNVTAAAWTAGFQWWRSGDITRTRNISEYMLVLALCLVVHYWADLQSGHGLRCYGNLTQTLVTTYKLASIPPYDDRAKGRLGGVCARCWPLTGLAGDGGLLKIAHRIWEVGVAGSPVIGRRRAAFSTLLRHEIWTAGFHWWRSGNKKRTQNVCEYMLLLARPGLCFVYVNDFTLHLNSLLNTIFMRLSRALSKLTYRCLLRSAIADLKPIKTIRIIDISALPWGA